MKAFLQVVGTILFISSYLISGAQPWPQGVSLASIQSSSPGNPSVKNNFGVTACGNGTLNLDANVAPETPPQGTNSGSMNNDTWFAFKAASTVSKIRICDPTFDAAVEVYRLSTGALITSFNIAGDGAREYGIASGLEINQNYAVRVGRYSGSGTGTFSFNVEYFSTYLLPNYSPAPPGNTCYTRTHVMHRNAPGTTPLNVITSTRWKFVSTNEPGSPDVLCLSSSGMLTLSSCFAFCLGDQFNVYCEALANDAECGPNWWGYSIYRPINFCDQVCLGISSPANNSSIPIRSTTFQTSNLGAGVTVQWRFVTDNGATELCSPWQSSHLFTPSGSFANCLDFNKFYSVSLRIRYCADDPEPQWCTPITVYSQPLPKVEFIDSDCCIWRNKLGNIAAEYIGFQMHQYRFRFTPVANVQNPCPSQNLSPIGPSITTGWLTYYGTSTYLPSIQQGTIYNVQVQGRYNSVNCTSCDGSQNVLPARYVDWGPPCLMGFRTNNGPPAGTALSCGCNFGTGLFEAWDEELYSALIAQFGTIEENPDDAFLGEPLAITELEKPSIGIYNIAPGTIQVDLSALQVQGNAEIRIHDINGRLISSRAIISTEDKSAVLVAANRSLSTGVYVISIIGQDAVITEKIFIRGE